MFSAFFSYFSHWRLYFLLIAIHLILNTNRNAGSLVHVFCVGMEKIIPVIYARRHKTEGSYNPKSEYCAVKKIREVKSQINQNLDSIVHYLRYQTSSVPFSLTHFFRPQIPQIEDLGAIPTITTT